jgi:O-methyltransferase
MLRRLIKAALRRSGYELVRPGASLAVQDSVVAAHIAVVRASTMLPDHRLASLYHQVQHLQKGRVAGAFVECGVWRGGSAGMVALAAMGCEGADRDIHLFDTFEGIPEPDGLIDGDRAVSEARELGVGSSGRLTANPQFYTNQGRSFGPVQECLNLLTEAIGYPAGLVHIHQGLFQERVPEDAEGIGPIALLHLDGDWHDSTRICLEHLYDQVVPGGLVTIDDYGAYDGCRCATDAFFSSRGISPYLHRVDSEARTFVKP